MRVEGMTKVTAYLAAALGLGAASPLNQDLFPSMSDDLKVNQPKTLELSLHRLQKAQEKRDRKNAKRLKEMK